MSEKRQLRLGAFMRPISIHTGAWRYPGALPDANFNFPAIRRYAQTLERGKFDAFFMADHLAVLNMPLEALKRSHTTTSFEPFTLLSALAGATDHIGLVATASTTFMVASFLIGACAVAAQVLVPLSSRLAPEAERGKVTGTPVGCACGDGVIDWARVIRICRKAKRDIVFSVECGTVEQGERSLQHLKSLL